MRLLFDDPFDGIPPFSNRSMESMVVGKQGRGVKPERAVERLRTPWSLWLETKPWSRRRMIGQREDAVEGTNERQCCVLYNHDARDTQQDGTMNDDGL